MNLGVLVRKYICAVFLCFFSLGCLTANAGWYGYLQYEINGDEVTITSCDQNNASGTFIIPSQIEGLPVTTIGYDAFSFCRYITQIIVPASVTTIESDAFWKCESLASISLPNTLTSLGGHAFYGCTSLHSITLPEGLNTLQGNTFYGCTALTSIEIPENITTISWLSPFGGCSSLSSITVAPSNTNFTTVDGVLFDAAETTLITYPGGRPGTSYSIPASVTTIGAGAFAGCSVLQSLTVPGRVGEIKDYTFRDIHSLEHIVLEEGITSIGWAAFLDGGSLIDISLPEGLTEIDTYAFVGCSSLTNLYLPSTVSSIGDYYHFDECDSLMSIDVAPGNPYFSSIDGVLCDAGQMRIMAYPAGRTGTYTMPQNLTGIEEYAFYGCNLQGITLSTNLTYLGESVFHFCESLLDVTIPDSITHIPDYAFRFCTSMTNVTFPDGLVSIGQIAFYECNALERIILPDTVTSIGQIAFRACNSATELRLSSSLSEIGSSVFADCDSLKGVIIPESISTLGNYAFGSCDVLNNVVFLGDAPSMGTDVFDSAHSSFRVYYLSGSSGFSSPTWEGYPAEELSLQYESDGDSITITDCPSNTAGDLQIPYMIGNEVVTTIAPDAFQGCSQISSITISAGVETLDNGMFSGCSALDFFAVQSSNPYYYSSAGVVFDKNRTQLIAYPVGNTNAVYHIPFTTVTGIVSRAFLENTFLSSVTLPANVDALSPFAFNDCENMSSVSFLGDAPSLVEANVFHGLDTDFVVYYKPESNGFTAPQWQGYSASPWIFYHQVSGDSVAIINADTNVGGAVIIPSHINGLPVTDIGDNAFDGCSLLTSITLSSTVINIGDRAFKDCSALSSFWIHAGNPAFNSSDGVLFDASQSELVAFPANRASTYIVPSSVVSIGAWAFEDSPILEEVTLPEGLTAIGGGAFYGCPMLNSITIPYGVTSISGFAFVGCSQLGSACFLGDAPTSMGVAAFSGTDPSFTVYYLSGRAGFSSPTWMGYPSIEIDQSAYPSAFWLLAQGLDYDTAMDQDLNGDGVSLLMAYALNLNPNLDLSGSLPPPVIEMDAMSMTYYAGRTSILYTVETSTNLVEWTTNGVTISEPDLNDEITALVDLAAPYRFLRLTVQQ